MLVGRDDEVTLLERALARARSGRGCTVFVAGEPGIGKTALAATADERARGAGMATAWGRCREDGGAPPYWPWAQVVRTVSSRSPIPGGEAVRSDVLSLLSPDPAPTATAFRLFESVGAVLAAAASKGGLLVVLDDLHRADEPSLKLLAYLAAAITETPLVLLACYRDTELRPGDAMTSLLGDADRSASESVDLRGLDDASVDQLVTDACGRRLSPSDAAEVRARTGGNPLFAIEIGRSMRTGDGRVGALPPTVRALILQRVRHLPRESARAVRIASVLGRSFGGLPLAAVMGCSELAAVAALQPAAGVQLITTDADGRYHFIHALVQEALYEDIDVAERVDLHRRAAEALAGLPERRDDVVADTAFHSHRAALAGDPSAALAPVVEAGRRAASRRAHGEAERWFGRAIELAERAHRLSPELLIEAADSALRAGHRTHARAWYEAAFELASRSADVENRARAAAGVGAAVVSAGTVDWRLVELLELAIEASGSNPAGQATLTGRLAIELYWSDRGDRARELSATALQLAEASGDDRAVAAALHARQFTLRSPQFLPERLAIGRRVVSLAESIGDVELAFHGHAWLAADVLRTADLSGFLAEIDALRGIAERSQEPLHRWYALLYQAELASIRGEMMLAWRLADEAGVLGTRLGVPVAAAYRVGQLAVLARDLDRWAEIEPDVREAVERYPHFVTLRAILVLLSADAGRSAEVRVELDRLSPDRFAAVPPDSLWVATVALLAEAAALSGSRHVAVLGDLLADHQGELLVQGLPSCWGAADRVLGLVAAARGEPDQARRALNRAAETNRAMGAVAWLARTQLDRSRLHGAAGDRGGAATALAEARSLADTTGLAGIARALAAEGSGGSADHRGLSPREREVIALVAAGASNKVIAKELVVSINTVERHLANIYTKLEIGGRAEAAAFAVRNGLAGPHVAATMTSTSR